jgi:hypothetical protein
MPSRVTPPVPGVNELIRDTRAPAKAPAPKTGRARPRIPEPVIPETSGRVRHEEKITVYVSADELIAVEQARLRLQQQGIKVDRGRFVRAAIASALDDLGARGLKADIVERLGD